MQSQLLSLQGLILVTPKVWRDDRGFFLESYEAAKYHAAGVACNFVQDNHSLSARGTVRGMHFQLNPGQDKLVRVIRGTIWDVAVDIRPGSATFGAFVGVELDAECHAQLFVPRGFAHGFCVLSPEAEVLYKVSAPYAAAEEAGFAHDDPAVGIGWPVAKSDRRLSARDQAAPSLASWREALARTPWANAGLGAGAAGHLGAGPATGPSS